MDLHVEVVGEGPPVLLLHGFTGSSESWRRQVEAWAPFFTLIMPDLPGHGLSPSPRLMSDYRLFETMQALYALVDRYGVQRRGITAVHMVGYSLGGRLALTMAAYWPSRIGALVLESASPGLMDEAARKARRADDLELADFIQRQGIEAFVERWEALPLWASQARLPAEVRAELHTQRLRNNRVGLANSLRGVGTGRMTSQWHVLSTLEAPTLLLAGQDDAKFMTIAGEMGVLIPNNEVVLVAGAGHTIHLEQPAVYNRLVHDFLLQHNHLLEE